MRRNRVFRRKERRVRKYATDGGLDEAPEGKTGGRILSVPADCRNFGAAPGAVAKAPLRTGRGRPEARI